MDFDYSAIKQVKNLKQAKRVVRFLISRRAFDLEMTDWRKKARKEAVFGSLKKERHKFWFVRSKKDRIIGAVGVYENERKNGGYYLDYFAVDKNMRRKGLGSRLLQKVEDFVRSCNGRFILIDTGSTNLFRIARKFYRKHGYRKVSCIPDYYGEGDSRIDYYKKIT